MKRKRRDLLARFHFRDALFRKPLFQALLLWGEQRSELTIGAVVDGPTLLRTPLPIEGRAGLQRVERGSTFLEKKLELPALLDGQAVGFAELYKTTFVRRELG